MCRLIVNLVMLPALLQKQLRSVSFFSMITLTLTTVAMVLIISCEISHMSDSSVKREPLKLIDFQRLPVFMATQMCLFEGNTSLLNIYAEVDKP